MDECYPLVYSTAYRLLGSQEEACDATQEAFVRAFHAITSFREDSSFSTWLYRIVTNVCLDRLRRQQREPLGLELLTEDGEFGPVREVPDDAPDPAEQAARSERQQVVQECLQGLTDDHRAVIVLYDINGFSYEEIAEMLDLPLGTVKSRLSRARMALKQRMERHLELFEPL